MGTRAAGTIPLEELASLPKFAMVEASHDGDKVAFYYDVSGRFELYQLDLETRELEQLTHGEAPKGLRADFSWTRDGQAIVFAKDQDGDEHNNIHLLAIPSSKVVQLNSDPDTQEYVGEVHPDNRTLAVMSNREGQMNLFTFDLANHTWNQLTDFEAPAFGGSWSPDGAWLAFTSNASPDLRNADTYLVSKDGSEVKKVFSVAESSQDAIAAWHPDGRRVAVSSDAEGNTRSGILDLETGQVRWLGEPGVDLIAQSFSPDGRWLAALRNHDATVMPVLFDVASGAARELALPTGVAVGSAFVLGGSHLVTIHTSDTRRAELGLYELDGDRYQVLLAPEYGSIDPADFTTHSYLRYPSFDAQQVPALLYAPKGATDDDRLPALVMVHGGPTAQYFRGFDPYAQFLSSRGYVVLQPNVRGSTGYGVAWRDTNIMDWGGGDLEDVAAGADYLRTLPYVDPERIGVFGGSCGGYMSFMAVTKKPSSFAVGIPWIGISDLHKLYEEDMSHFKYYLRQQMGDPEENHDLWRDRSAIEFAANVTAKLLIVHGVNDPRYPIDQARDFRDRLLELGRREGEDFEYHEFGDEGHGPSGDIQGTIHTYRLMADFLERRL